MTAAKIIFLGAISAFILSSCASRIAYTSNIQQKYRLTESDIKGIQFYLSEDIILKGANEALTSSELDEGELIVTSDKTDEKIVIREGTPGIVYHVKGSDRIAVSFEPGDEKFLMFGSTGRNGEYKLLAEKWVNRKGKLTYDGKTFYATPGSGESILLFKIKKLNKYSKKERVAKGEKIK